MATKARKADVEKASTYGVSDNEIRYAMEDSNRMSFMWFNVLNFGLALISMGTIVWVMLGVDYAGSSYIQTQREYYIYVFDTIYMYHGMQSRLVGVVITCVAFGLWLAASIAYKIKRDGCGSFCVPSKTPEAAFVNKSEAMLMWIFRQMVWVYHVAVILTIATDAGTNDFWQLLTICLIEIAATLTALSLKVRSVKSGSVPEANGLVNEEDVNKLVEEAVYESPRVYIATWVVWIVPQLVIAFNQYRVFSKGSWDSDTLATIVLVWGVVWTAVLFKGGMIFLIMNNVGPINSAHHSSDESAKELDESDVIATLQRNRQAEISEAAQFALDNAKKPAIHLKVIFAVAAVALVWSIVVAGVGEKASAADGVFRTRLPVHSHSGSAKVRISGTVVENFNFVEHTYNLHVMWMFVAALIPLVLMWGRHVFDKDCLQKTMFKAYLRTPDLMSHVLLGLSSGIVSALVMAQAGYDDPMTMFAVAVMGAAGLMLLSMVRTRFHEALQFWMFSTFMAIFPVVIILVALTMRYDAKKWSQNLVGMIGMFLVFGERLMVIIATFPGEMNSPMFHFGRWFMFFLANSMVVANALFVMIFGMANAFEY